MNANPSKSIAVWLAPALTVVLLGAVLVGDKLRVDPSDAAPFLKRTAIAFSALPRNSGDWVLQREFPLEEETIKLLAVNAYVHRTYSNLRTGEMAEVLFVQCRDARAMQGHFPPICYPSSGCKIRSTSPVQHWSIRGGPTVPGIEYEVMRPDGGVFIVRDFFVLPNGKFATDMTSVMIAAKNYQQLVYGGAQVQVLFTGKMPSDRRDTVFSDLMSSYADLLQTLRSAQCTDTASGQVGPIAINAGVLTAGWSRPD